MQFSVYSGGAWRTPKGVWVYTAGAWRVAKGVWDYASGAWRQGYTSTVPPTAVPSNLNCTDDSFCDTSIANYVAGATWTNTDSTDDLDVEWTVNGTVAVTHGVFSGSTSDSVDPNAGDPPLRDGDSVKFRARYTNSFGQGPWSGYSNTVVIATLQCV